MGIALLPSLLHLMRKQQPWGVCAELSAIFLTAARTVSSPASCCWRSCACICVIHRATTYYLADRRFDMLPSILSADVCSLLGGVDRWVCSLLLSSELVLPLLWWLVTLTCGLFLVFFLIYSPACLPTPAFPLHPLHPAAPLIWGQLCLSYLPFPSAPLSLFFLSSCEAASPSCWLFKVKV